MGRIENILVDNSVLLFQFRGQFTEFRTNILLYCHLSRVRECLDAEFDPSEPARLSMCRNFRVRVPTFLELS